jgi:hypothetical protein
MKSSLISHLKKIAKNYDITLYSFYFKNLFCNEKVVFFYDGMWNFSVEIVRSFALYFFYILKEV